MNTLLKYWPYAHIAYQYPDGKEALFHTAIDFIPLDFELDFGYIVRFRDCILYVCRGTKELTTKAGLKAWRRNFDNFPKEKGHIHHGFYDAWMPFKPEINAYLRILQKKKSLVLPPIYCTGHSRGGCPAILCARHIAKNLKIPCSCITYGNPRCGDKVFRNEFHMLPIDCIGVKNGYDIVMGLPPKSLGFRHVGRSYWIPQPFYHALFCKIHDHKPESYNYALNKHFKNQIVSSSESSLIL